MTIAYASRDGASLPLAGSATLTITKPSGTVAGDLLIVYIICSANTVITPVESGWTTDVTAAGIRGYHRIAGASEPASYGFTRAATTNTIVGHMARLTSTIGFPADPVDAVGAQAGGSGTTVVLPTITVAKGTLLWQMGQTMSNCTFTPQTGPPTPTEDYDYQPATQTFGVFGGHEAATPGATGTRTWTASVTGTRSGVMYSLKEIILETPTDTEGLTDTVTGAMGMVETPTDPEGLTDTVTPALGMVNTRTDTEGLTDTATASLGIGVSTTDTEGLTDTVGVSLNLGVPAQDTEGLTDSVTASMGLADTPTDTEGLTDQVTVVLDVLLAPTDTLSVTDVVTAAMGFTASQVEAFGLTDTVTAALALASAIDDAMGLTDDVTDVLTCTPADWPLDNPTRVVAGVIMNHETNLPVEGVMVRLMRDDDDVKVQTQTSGPGGVYAFPRDSLDPYTYHVYAEGTDGATQVQGVSERGIIPENL